MHAPPSVALSPILPSLTAPRAAQTPTPTPTPPSPPASSPPSHHVTCADQATYQQTTHRRPRTSTEPHRTAPSPRPRPPGNTSQQAQHTTPARGCKLTENGTPERAHHHPHASPTPSCTTPQHRSHTVSPLPPTGRALQPTARGTTTTTSSRRSNTYWQPRPRAHKPTSKPQNRRNPTTPCDPASYPP